MLQKYSPMEYAERICGDERAFGEIKGIVAADHLGSESQRHDEGRIF